MTQPKEPEAPADFDDLNWYVVADSKDVEDGSAKEIVLRGQVVAIFRNEEELCALDGMCAHQGGPIAEGVVASGCVTCPWHGWQYELKTGVQTINQRPLQQVFAVRERDGKIEIGLSESAD